MHDIEKPSNPFYFVACNPLKDIYHRGSVNGEGKLTTGQPLMITGLDEDTTYDLIYSSYNFTPDIDLIVNPEEEKEEVLTVVRGITWSVGYTLEDATEVLGAVKQILPDLYVQPIKHPDRDEYALPWSDYIIDSAPNGGLKDTIHHKHLVTIVDGNSKTKEEMIEDGWI